MNTAMLISSFPNLSEKFLINQITGMADVGAMPDIFSVVRPSAGPRHELAERYGLYGSTRYAEVPRSIPRRLQTLPTTIRAALRSGPGKVLRALDARSYRIAARNLKNLYFLPLFAGKHYDLLHCHFGPNGLIGAYLKDCGFAERLVVSFHGSDINTYPSRYGTDIYRTLYDRADLVTVNSAFTRAKVISNGCPEGKVKILPVGLRMEEYPETDFEEHDPLTLLTVGRLVEKKGHRYALEAFSLLRKRFPEARYIIAGGGPLRGKLEAHAAALDLGDSVVFLGDQRDTQKAELYRKASVFVLPSVTAQDGDMEGQGLVLQEAQASGVPVVSTLHNGIPDGVLDGQSGFLVPERDGPALADRIGRLFADMELRRSMGRAGKSFVAGKYDIPILTERLLALYSALF